MSYIRKRAIEGLSIGDTFIITRTFTENDMINFAELTRDYNPIHFDKRYVEEKNFDDCICHGLLVASIITEIGGQIGWLASGMDLRFRKPVYFGDTIKCTFTITEISNNIKTTAEAEFINQNDDIVLEATLHGFIPGEPEKKILSKMIEEGDPTNKF